MRLPTGLGLMVAACVGIDLLRQRHMRYKAEQLVIINKIIRAKGLDPRRQYSFRDKVSVLCNLGLNLFVQDF